MINYNTITYEYLLIILYNLKVRYVSNSINL